MNKLKYNITVNPVISLILLLTIGLFPAQVLAAAAIPENVIYKSGEKGVHSLAGSVAMNKQGIQFTCFNNIQFRHIFKNPAMEEEWAGRLKSGRVIPVVITANFYMSSGGKLGSRAKMQSIFLHAAITDCKEFKAPDLCASAKKQGISPEICDSYLKKVTPDALVDKLAVSLDKIFTGANTKDGGKYVMTRSLRISNTSENPAELKILGMQLTKADYVETLKINPKTKDQMSWEIQPNSFHDEYISFISYAKFSKGDKALATFTLMVDDTPVKITKEVIW